MIRAILILGLMFLGMDLLPAQEGIMIGELGTEGELLYPRQIQEGPEGNIYIYDQMDGFFKVYSPHGRFLRKFGGEGQGPGEVQRKEAVFFGFTPGGNFFFSEYFTGHAWISIIDLQGKFVRALKPDIKEFFGVLRIRCLADGRFLTEFHFLGKPEREKDHFYHRSPVELVMMEGDGSIRSRLKRTNDITSISYESRGADSPIPFQPLFLWAPYRENTVIYTDGLSRKLRVINYRGEPVREISTPLPEPAKVTDADLGAWRKRRREMLQKRNPDWWSRFGNVIEKYKKSIYKHHPNLSGLAVTPDGNILLAGLREQENNQVKYWLVSEENRVLFSLSTRAGQVSISPHFIFFTLVDEEMITSVFALERSGSESDDLARLSNELK